MTLFLARRTLLTALTAAVLAPLAMAAGPKNQLSAPESCVARMFRDWVTVEVEIYWTDTSDNEDGFTIEYSSGKVQWTWNVPADAESLTLQFLSMPADGLDGSFRVRAFNASGVSKWSNRARISDRHGGGVTGNG